MITDSQASNKRNPKIYEKKNKRSGIRLKRNKVHNTFILPIKSEKLKSEFYSQKDLECNSSDNISICQIQSYLLQHNYMYLNRTDSNMNKLPVHDKLLKKRANSNSSRVFDGLYSQGNKKNNGLKSQGNYKQMITFYSNLTQNSNLLR